MKIVQAIKAQDAARLSQIAIVIVLLLASVSCFAIESSAVLTGFVAMLIATAAPAIYWIRKGSIGIPLFPITAALYVPLYVVPVLAGIGGEYGYVAILTAEVTVAVFLLAAFLAWTATAFPKAHLKAEGRRSLAMVSSPIVLGMLAMDVIFEIGLSENWWSWAGPTFGVLRSISMSSMSVGCLLFGTMLGQRKMSALSKIVGATMISIVTLVELSGLMMHTTIIYMCALVVGYALSSYRIPWIGIVAIVSIAAILNTAKGDMRAQYWNRGGQALAATLTGTPVLLVRWFGVGLDDLDQETSQSGQHGLIGRSSQLGILLMVENETPQNIPYLNGWTYRNLPKMLIPRFVEPGKMESQENLHLLSVRYGLQTLNSTDVTTIGWNLVPEAYANFGYIGVVAAGVLYGLVIGLLTRISVGVPLLSYRGLLSVTALTVLVDGEYDLSYLFLNLTQSLISITVVCLVLRAVMRSKQASHHTQLLILYAKQR